MSNGKSRSLAAQLRRHLVTGFLVWIPVAAVVLAMYLVYSLIQSWLLPELRWQSRLYALGALFATLFATGWLVNRFHVVRKLLKVLERRLEAVPGVRWVYTGVRRLTKALLSERDALGKVVLIEYPRRGVYSLAFQMAGGLGEVQHRVRARMAEKDGAAPAGAPDSGDGDHDVMAVFVPTTPNPTSGMVLTLPREEVVELEMTREQALQMIISLGVVVPKWSGPDPPPNAPSGKATPTAPAPPPPDGRSG